MYLKIKAIPDAKEDRVERIKEDEYRIWVKVPAEGGRANKRIIELVQELYPNRRIRLVSGHTSPSKIISVSE